MDTAKATSAVINNPGIALPDMEALGKVPQPHPALPGRSHHLRHRRRGHPHQRHHQPRNPLQVPHYLFPYFFSDVALIDGNLLTKLPSRVIAATGMDALCHALESYVNLNTNPIKSVALDLKAIGMISQWLRPAVANANLEAMSHMVLASTIAGLGFANTKVTIVHSMSHPVSGFYGVPHG